MQQMLITSYVQKWSFVLVATIGTLAVALFFFIDATAQSSQLARVKELVLSPSDVKLASVQSQLASARANRPVPSTLYSVRQDGSQCHFYFVGGGSPEKVTGEMPKLESPKDVSFRGLTDVASATGVMTYTTYVQYGTLPFGAARLVASDLYALKGNRIHKVVSHIQPGCINGIDKRTLLSGCYVDQRGNLFTITENGTLCVVEGGQIIAKSDVRKIGVRPPLNPSMFSDAENTYLLVPKVIERGKTIFTYGGPVTENEIVAKYRIDL
jgi:hypothetical protein